MSSDAPFGPTNGRTEVGNGVEATLSEWMPTYLGFETRKLASLGVTTSQGLAVGNLPAPGAYVHSSDPNHFPEEQPPAVLICIPGTMDTPLQDGSRNYRTFYDVRLTVFVTAATRDDTEALAGYYSEALRMVILQKPALNGVSQGVKWLGESFDVRINDDDQRTLGSAENRFRVDARNVVQAFAGPMTPTVTPPPDWPAFQSARVNVQPESL